MALQTDHEILGVVENMSYYVCSHGGRRIMYLVVEAEEAC